MKNLILILLIMFVSSCNNNEVVKMSTTTSLNDSGILDVLADEFYEETGITLEWISVGSGEAMEIAKTGDVSLAFLHSPKAEAQFVEDGYSLQRNIVMSNNFLIVGPKKLDGNLDKVIENIINNELFISRGDNSGTHSRQLQLFNTTPKNYEETGLGMGETLQVTSELQGYTLVDKATWLANKDKLNLVEVYNGQDDRMLNIYSIHLIEDNDNAKAFIKFLQSEKGQEIIRTFGVDKYGEGVYKLE